MLQLLENLISQRVEIMLGGHYIVGTIINLNLSDRLLYLQVMEERWIISVDQVQMLKLKESL